MVTRLYIRYLLTNGQNRASCLMAQNRGRRANVGAFQEVEYPELGTIEVVAPPYKFSETQAWVRGPAPQLGEHNYDVLATHLSMSPQEIQELTVQGVLYESEAAKRRRLEDSLSG